MKNKKIFVTAPWKIEFVEDEFNETIDNPNEVIVENVYSHLSAGTEMACVSGIESWFQIPATPGYTAVGKVIEKGDNATGIEKGDLIFTFGPHAKYFKIDITDRWHGVCVKVPEGLQPDIASFTHMGGIAMTSLRASSIELGDYVAVAGMGTIGNLAAQFAQLQGANVVVVDINKNRLEIAQKSGIRNVINSGEENLEKAINEFTLGNKVSAWIDATGLSAVIEEGLNHIAQFGEMILLGSPRAPYETNLTQTLQKVHLLDAITMKGALEFTYPTHNNEFIKHSIERNSAIIMDLMNTGKLKISPFYSHKMNPADAQEAYEGLRDKPEEYIGVVFDWNV